MDKLSSVLPRGLIRENSMLYQRIGCVGAGCLTNREYNRMPLENWNGQWTSWLVHSDESASAAPFKVLRHKWFLEGYVVGWDGKATEANVVGEPHIIRCDSAPFYGRTKACIYDEVIPHLQYSAAPDSKVKEVADHIQCAQNSRQCETWPQHPLMIKTIPGKFFEGDPNAPGLHRILRTHEQYAKNRREVPKACNRQGVYGVDYGLPATRYKPGQDCDEYPFASTTEGAARDGENVPPNGSGLGWNYSVLGVDRTQNRCAGSALRKFYADDRILWTSEFGHQDTFYVKITNTPPSGPQFCDGPPEDEDEVEPGGEPTPNQPPVAYAGPDVSGAEGGAVSLVGDVSDPDGTASAQWTYSPGPGTDPGATCWFADAGAERGGFTCNDDGTYTVTLTASDGEETASDSATVTLDNVSPRLSGGGDPARTKTVKAAGTGLASPQPWSVYRAGNEVKLVAPITDPGTNDTFTCNADWDDGIKETYHAGQPTFDKGCDRTHTFKNAGMYTIKASVTDDDTGTTTESVMVVVYDPGAGFATGGGWIDSPAGALTADPDATGKGHFQSNPKYHRKDTGPAPSGGKVGFRLDGTDLRLDSTALDWLVITPDGKVAVSGTGTVAGKAGYGFVVYGHQNPGRFRVVIWPLADGAHPGGTPVYDNRATAGFDVDVAEPQQITGSIRVHQ